jgi:hypothetical protein
MGRGLVVHRCFKWLECGLVRHDGAESAGDAMRQRESYLRSHSNVGSHNQVRILAGDLQHRSG